MIVKKNLTTLNRDCERVTKESDDGNATLRIVIEWYPDR